MNSVDETPPVGERSELLRVLGVTFGGAVVVGGMIGIGILRTPGIVAANMGAFWPIIAIWIVAGLYTLLERQHVR